MFTTASLRFVVILSLAAFLASGCGRSPASRAKDEAPAHEPLIERIARFAAHEPSGGVSSEKHLAGAKRVLAKGFEGAPAFYVAARLESLRRFPCRECHAAPPERLKAQTRNEKKAHWEIELRHAAAEIMNCATCHAGGNTEFLKMLNGQPVGFNHAYQMCAQCHASQVKDWAGGAHGKRLGGWAPPRVVVNCAACHDPHQPTLEKRWPSRSSRLHTARE